MFSNFLNVDFWNIKKNHSLIVLAFYFAVLNSCKVKIIHIHTNGLSSKRNKSMESCPEIFTFYDSIYLSTTKNSSSSIIISTGNQILKSLQAHDKNLVYMWSPHCKSKNCYDLSLLQNRCKESNINLIVVAEYYDCFSMSRKHALENQIVAIDTRHYKSNLVKNYVKKFLADMNIPLKKNEYGRYYLFEKSTFVKRMNNPDSIFQKRES